MNAKKIMGAVLVALLAAALFTGAAAADDLIDIGPVTTYTDLNGASFTVTTSASGTITVTPLSSTLEKSVYAGTLPKSRVSAAAPAPTKSAAASSATRTAPIIFFAFM